MGGLGMKTTIQVMTEHLEWLKKERVRVVGEINTLQHGLKEIDETIENWTETINVNNPESK